jgi:hypothetical protein
MLVRPVGKTRHYHGMGDCSSARKSLSSQEQVGPKRWTVGECSFRQTTKDEFPTSHIVRSTRSDKSGRSYRRNNADSRVWPNDGRPAPITDDASHSDW